MNLAKDPLDEYATALQISRVTKFLPHILIKIKAIQAKYCFPPPLGDPTTEFQSVALGTACRRPTHIFHSGTYVPIAKQIKFYGTLNVVGCRNTCLTDIICTYSMGQNDTPSSMAPNSIADDNFMDFWGTVPEL